MTEKKARHSQRRPLIRFGATCNLRGAMKSLQVVDDCRNELLSELALGRELCVSIQKHLQSREVALRCLHFKIYQGGVLDALLKRHVLFLLESLDGATQFDVKVYFSCMVLNSL